jgi:hypothetical protein
MRGRGLGGWGAPAHGPPLFFCFLLSLSRTFPVLVVQRQHPVHPALVLGEAAALGLADGLQIAALGCVFLREEKRVRLGAAKGGWETGKRSIRLAARERMWAGG